MAFDLKLVEDMSFTASPNVGGGGIAQFTAVVIDTAGGANVGDCIQATGATAPILGINQSVGGPPTTSGGTDAAVAAGQSMSIRSIGISKVIAGGAITAGQFVACNGSGQAVAVTSLNPATTATNTYIIGQAQTAATAAGDTVSVLLMQGTATLVTT